MMVKKNEDGAILYEGYSVDLMNELVRILKFKYEFYLSPDGKYGALTDNGTWDGMMREIVNRVCRLILNFTTILQPVVD